MIASPPVLTAQAHRHVHRLTLGVRVNLDPAKKCSAIYTAADYAVEPDLSEDGYDSCGSPQQATVVIRTFSAGHLSVRRAVVKLKKERGSAVFHLQVFRGKTSWAVTVLNPIGQNVTIRG